MGKLGTDTIDPEKTNVLEANRVEKPGISIADPIEANGAEIDRAEVDRVDVNGANILNTGIINLAKADKI